MRDLKCVLGTPFFGKDTNDETIREVLSSAETFAHYGDIDYQPAQSLIDGLIAFIPEERISSIKALTKSFFRIPSNIDHPSKDESVKAKPQYYPFYRSVVLER